MYDWLRETIDESTTLVTANRRLARTLRLEFGRQQAAAGIPAWRSPDIIAWPDWVNRLLDESGAATRINSQQSRVLWERCLRRELDENGPGLATLARLAGETWQRLADARVSIREVAASAQNDDHRMYASAAGTYLAVLEGAGWVDAALAADAVLNSVREGRLAVTRRIVLAGFDRETMSREDICTALRDSGTIVEVHRSGKKADDEVLLEYENGDAEMRAAGAWARGQLERDPGLRLAIVKQGLEQSAERDVRLLREGFVPGWQYSGSAHTDAVNVSYGRRFADYPAVSVALLGLRWLSDDLSSRELAALLMSPFIGVGEIPDRSRLELRLRDLPERSWSPAMVTSALRSRNAESDWLKRIAALGRQRREQPSRATAAEWAERLSAVLDALGWPGPGTLDSRAYQLVNRWRELLNDFARLDLVSDPMSVREAVRRLESIATDTVFQPESPHAAIQLLGPLEAAGLEFDAVWIAGLTAANWPAPGRPSALVSRKLQHKHAMPDSSPADTLDYAEKVLGRLFASAGRIVCSWSRIADDTEQTVSELLRERTVAAAEAVPDPGWHAAMLSQSAVTIDREDTVPGLTTEKVFGGAATIEAQLDEPFAAFVGGRLGARRLNRQAVGIPAALRGNVVHDALYRLYQELPDSSALRALGEAEINEAAGKAAAAAFVVHERNSDAVLLKLLQLERVRIARLLARFVHLDRERDDFRVAGVEGRFEFRHGDLQLSLRFDRIDEFDDGSIAILDYKTGATRELLTKKGEVREPQLFVYAMAAESPVAALALVNIDSREIVLSGGGRGFGDEDNWPELLDTAAVSIRQAADDFIAGDVRIDAGQSVPAARTLNLLSRFTELRRDD